MKLKPIHIFLFLSLAFIIYSFSIYLRPYSLPKKTAAETSAISEGRLVWQKYNCQSCHQLYGLGGYLGPDLSNIYSTKGKNPEYLKAMLTAGVAQMPVFDLSEEEQKSLLSFLKEVDKSGSADPRDFDISISGMITHKK